MKKVYYILLLLCITITYAQDEIETSPDQYETPSTVPKAHFQMENRFTFQDDGKHAYSIIAPSTNWKYGITDYAEVIMVTNLAYQKIADSTASGLQPLTFGIKVTLWNGKGLLPDTAISAQLSIPKLASKDWLAAHLAPNLRILLKHKITNTISTGINLGAIWDGETPNARFFYSISPKFKLSHKWECFAEAYGYLNNANTAKNWVDGGFMYLITKTLQAELSAGYELSATDMAHSCFGLAGIAFRI